MAFVITDECLSCGSCAAQCPAEAIDMGDLHYEIDASKCLFLFPAIVSKPCTFSADCSETFAASGAAHFAGHSL